MTIQNAHIIRCPEHGLFYSPDYWPCPFCFEKEHIKVGPMAWTTTYIMWEGEEQKLTLRFIQSDDESWQRAWAYLRPKNPAP